MDNETIKSLVTQLDELKGRVEVLEAWKTQKERQQLTFPLDYVSQQILIGLQ